MKKTTGFIASALALTFIFYLLAYYLLPPPSPSAPVVALFAAIAMAAVWGSSVLYRKTRGHRNHVLIPVLVLSVIAALAGYKGAPRRDPGSSTLPNTSAPSPPPPGSGAPSSAVTARVTGTAFLLSKETEKAGYGLYSYVLLSHRPEASELARYKACLSALLELPTAEQVEQYIPKNRVNITFIPIDSLSQDWARLTLDERVTYVLAHYDFGRGAAMMASLATKTGPGPVIVSVLGPLDVSKHPRPVLAGSVVSSAELDDCLREFFCAAGIEGPVLGAEHTQFLRPEPSQFT